MKSRWISLIVFLSFTTLFVSLAPKSVPDSGGSSAWGDDEIGYHSRRKPPLQL